jgi:TonB-dependent receptor
MGAAPVFRPGKGRLAMNHRSGARRGGSVATLLLGASLSALLLGTLPTVAQAQTTPSDTQEDTAPAAQPSQSAATVQSDAKAPANNALPRDAQGTATAIPPAQADSADIVVTGLRKSIETAQAIKFNSDEFVDSVTATDIGKLPDHNVAEALQRISGIQITRNLGEGSSIAIRGLTQVKTELNGRDVFGGSDGRALGFEDVPSELLAGVDVYKDPSAKEIEGGIGGLVNLRTRMPFDEKGFVFATTVGANYYDLANDARFNGSALVSKTWQNTGIGDFGILVDLSYFDGTFRRDQVSIEPYVPVTDVPGHEGDTLSVPDGAGTGVTFGYRKRTGYYAALQWDPASNVHFYGTYFRSQYDLYTPNYSSFVTRGTSTEFLSYLTPNNNFSFDNNGNFISGGYNGFVPSYSQPPYVDTALSVQDNTQTTFGKTVTADYAGGVKWEPAHNLHVDLDLQYVRATAINRSYTLFGQKDTAGYNIDLDGNADGLPSVTFVSPPGGASVDDLSAYRFTAEMDHIEDSIATQKAGRLDLEWDFDNGFLSSIQGGIRYTDRSAINRSTPYNWTAATATGPDGQPLTLADPISLGIPNPYANDLFGGEGSDIVGAVPFASVALLNDPAGTFEAIGGRSLIDFGPQDINTQREKTYTGYAIAYFQFDPGLKIDGNIGVRVVKTQNDAIGSTRLTYRDSLAADSTQITVDQPFSASQDYTKVLPSLNLRAHLTNRLQLRGAVSEGMSRPPFADLRAIRQLSLNYTATTNPDGSAGPFVFTGATGSGGNPDLKPLTTDQADLALEWNISRSSFLYGTAFYKKLKNFETTRVYDIDYAVPGQGMQPFSYTALVNGTKGTIKGFELGGNTFFDFLPGPLAGFGVQANLTYVDSNAPGDSGTLANGDPVPTELQGLSKWSYNLVGIYEKYGFSARLAYNWRSHFLQTIASNGTGAVPIYNRAYGQLDASISYDFTPKVSISIDATNLTRARYDTYQYYEADPRTYELDDRRFGISFHIRN